MKIVHITTTEEMVMNPVYKGWRMARIEVLLEGQFYPHEVGRIAVSNNDELFEKVREAIEWSSADVEEMRCTSELIRCSNTTAANAAEIL